MTRFSVAAVLAVAVLAGACTQGASPVAVSTPASNERGPSAPSGSASAPATPQEEALAAYERYLAVTVDALSAGQAEDGQLSTVAADQALSNAKRRVRANRRDDVVVTGTLTPSATASDIELGGTDSAIVRDCVRNDLEQVEADDSATVVTEATGWRQPVTATVERRDDSWIVTTIKVPLRDGSGKVPPPPDDPPYLRGPAQGPAPPSCVPDDIAQEAIAAYEAFREAYDSALGLGRSGPADPDLPALAETAVDPQLSRAREFASELADEGQAFRGEPSSRDPWPISTLDSDKKVIVYDCVTVGANAPAEASATEPMNATTDVGTYRLDAAEVDADDAEWKVSAWAPLKEGLEKCTSAAS